jgi:hypothetical protein
MAATSISKHKDSDRWVVTVDGRQVGDFHSHEMARAAADLVVTGQRQENN